VDDGGLVHTKLNLAGLHLAHGARHVESDGSGLGIRHQPAWTENLAEPAHGLHHVWRGDNGVKIHPAALNPLHHVVAACFVSARFPPLSHLVAGSDHHHALRLAQAVRQHHRAAYHLIRVLGIDAQPDGHFHRLIEFGKRGLLEYRHRVGQGISRLVHKLCRTVVFFTHRRILPRNWKMENGN